VGQRAVGNLIRGWGALIQTSWRQQLRGNVTGVFIGIIPGAGADIAAWVAYSISKRFSRTPEKFGTGHLEGIIESTSANNAALAGAWVPALVFGIPGDTITAVAIGVLYLKGLNPGPTIFISHPESLYAVFIVFILANVLMLPFGWLAIKCFKTTLRLPENILMPSILLFSIVGAFAINNSMFGVLIMLCFGALGLFMEDNGFPVAPCVLGIVLGIMLEDNFVTSMMKAEGNLLAFFGRPIAFGLGFLTLAIWFTPLLIGAWRRQHHNAWKTGQPSSSS
jgi:TctA family transporter